MDGMGHNSGNAVITLDPDLIRDQLGIDHADLTKRLKELEEGYENWKKKLPNGIDNVAAAQKTTDFVKQVKALAKQAENTRTLTKGPYDAAASAVQAFFNTGIIQKATTWSKAMEAALTAFARAEEIRIRRESAAKAAAAQAEADRLAEEARKSQSVETMDQAVVQAEQAETFVRQAAAPTAALVQTRGDLGGVASGATRWKHEVTDLMALVKAVAAGETDIRYLQAADTVIGAAVRGATGVRDIPGVRIFPDMNVSVR